MNQQRLWSQITSRALISTKKHHAETVTRTRAPQAQTQTDKRSTQKTQKHQRRPQRRTVPSTRVQNTQKQKQKQTPNTNDNMKASAHRQTSADREQERSPRPCGHMDTGVEHTNVNTRHEREGGNEQTRDTISRTANKTTQNSPIETSGSHTNTDPKRPRTHNTSIRTQQVAHTWTTYTNTYTNNQENSHFRETQSVKVAHKISRDRCQVETPHQTRTRMRKMSYNITTYKRHDPVPQNIHAIMFLFDGRDQYETPRDKPRRKNRKRKKERKHTQQRCTQTCS